MEGLGCGHMEWEMTGSVAVFPASGRYAVGPSVYYILKATYYHQYQPDDAGRCPLEPCACSQLGGGFRPDHAQLAGTFLPGQK